jgi:hypothetical protein
MRDKYPSMAYKVPKSLDGNDRRFYLNLFYLQEHDLCETSTQENSDGFISWRGTKITAKGVDFLENDGGLSAILGVVRVKLHADTLRDILAKKSTLLTPPLRKNRLLRSRWAKSQPSR